MSRFEQTLREQLRNAEHNLDDTVTHQLVNARRQALAARSGFRLPRLALPAMGMVTASIVALVLFVAPLDDGLQGQGQGAASQESLTPENAAFYEDLEFFYWLAKNEPDQRS